MDYILTKCISSTIFIAYFWSLLHFVCFFYQFNFLLKKLRVQCMSFTNHCTEGISITKGFSLSNMLVAASCMLWMNGRPEGEVAIFAGASVWKLNTSRLLEEFVTYLFLSLYTCGSKIQT